MKTRTLMIGVAMVAALNCAAVNAQVLGGGNLGGGLGGTLSGGLRDMNVMTQGGANGSFGSDLDTTPLRRGVRDTAERTTGRVRDTAGTVRDRAKSKVDQTRDAASTTVSPAVATASNAVNDVQIESAADAAGSATSTVSRDGVNLAGDAQGAASGAGKSGAMPELPSAELPKQEPTKLADNNSPVAVPSATPSTSEPVKAAEPKRSLNLAGDANGSASASRDGVTAGGSGSGTASRK